MTIEVTKLTSRELADLISAAEKRRTLLMVRKPASTVRRLLAATAAIQGYALDEIFEWVAGTPARDASLRRSGLRRSGKKVAPKYRDPESPRNTWTGRGLMPRWLAAKVRQGHSAVDFLIPGIGRSTQPELTGKLTVFKSKPTRGEGS